MPVFYGARMQRGHDIGSIFSGLLRSIFPKLKRVALVIGKMALQTGIDIVSDVAAGQSLKECAKSRMTDALKEGISSFIPTGNTQSGSGFRRKCNRSKKPKTSIVSLRQKRIGLVYSAHRRRRALNMVAPWIINLYRR